MKKSISIVITIVLIGAMWWVVKSNTQQESFEPKEEKIGETVTEPKQMVVETKELKEETEKVIAEVKYPSTGVIKVDSLVEAFINGRIEEFKNEVQEFELFEGRKNTINIQFETNLASNKYTSFLFYVSVDTGGAHPNGNMVGKTYDMKQEKEVTLYDVFQGTEYEKKLSELVMPKLKAKLSEMGVSGDEEWLQRGAGPDKKNFESFTLTNNGIAFHFSPYQVAPYAFGGQSIELAKEKMSDMLEINW